MIEEPGGILSGDPEEIAAFAAEVGRFRSGKWAPDAFIAYRTVRGVYGQRQPDAQMLRVKIPVGILTAEMLEVLGRIARGYAGHRRGHVTTRESIQFHFTALEDAAAIMGQLAAVGLTTREAGGNVVRNVTGSPLAGVCPREPFDVTPYAAAYARYFLRHPLTQRLPRKFKSSFSCCEQDDTIADIQDLGFIPQVQTVAGEARRGFMVKVAGGTSIFVRPAGILSEFVGVGDYLRLSEAVLRVFDGCEELRHNRQRARLKYHVQRVGLAAFRGEVEAELRGPWAQRPVGLAPLLTLPASPESVPREAGTASTPAPGAVGPSDPAFTAWLRNNAVPQRQPGFRAVVVRLLCGNIEADQFAGLATLARRFGRGEVRLTPQQNLVLRWVDEERLADLHAALLELGLGAAANTLTDVTACPGTDSCKLAITASMELARELSRGLADLEHIDELLDAVHIKVSGCPNGCGQHHLADIGLEGATMRRGDAWVPCYHLYLGGRYPGGPATGGGPGTQFGQRIRLRFPAKNALPAVRRTLLHYRDARERGETFGAFVARLGPDAFQRLLSDLTEPPALGPETVDFYRDSGRTALFRLERGEGECSA